MLRVLVALALVLTPGACAQSDDSGSAPTPATSAASPELAPYVGAGGGPVGLTTTDDGAVWVVAARDGTVSRVPPGAQAPDLTVDLPDVPLRATAAFGSVWVTAFEGRRLLRIDPVSGEVSARLRTGPGPEGVAAGFGSIWVVVQDAGTLLRVDPGTVAVTATVEVGEGARLVTAGPEAMYVAHYADGAVLRVDPATNAVARSGEVCDGPQGMTVLEGTVWVSCTLGDEVVGLDAATLEPVARVSVEGSPDSVVATPAGRLVVVVEEGPALVVVDPAAAAVTDRLVLGAEHALGDRANLDLALSVGQAWVTSFNADRVYHLPLPG